MSADDPNRPPSSFEPTANYGDAAGKSRPPAKGWSVSRIVLLSLLVVCVGLLAVDLVNGRWPRQRAFDLLKKEMTERGAFDDDSMAEKGPPIGHDVKAQLTADDVHKLLGRQPDETAKATGGAAGEDGFVEIYKFRGALQNYTLQATYHKAMAAMGGSTLVAIR